MREINCLPHIQTGFGGGNGGLWWWESCTDKLILLGFFQGHIDIVQGYSWFCTQESTPGSAHGAKGD